MIKANTSTVKGLVILDENIPASGSDDKKLRGWAGIKLTQSMSIVDNFLVNVR